MSSKDDDQLGHEPKIAPAHDEVASYQRTQSKGRLANKLGEVPDDSQAGGTSALTRTLLAAVVVVLLVTASLAGVLYVRLGDAEQSLDKYETRIGELERRLEVTGESMSESSVAMKDRVKELDFEIRKLWDNVWKKSKQRLATNEKKLEQHTQQLKNLQQLVDGTEQKLAQNQNVMDELSTQLKQVEQMRATVSDNEQSLRQQAASLEATADRLSSLARDMKALDKRVAGTEEWVDSINAFRRQVNRELSSLKQAIGQSGAAAP